MQWNYLFKHWFATLLIAPLLTDLFFYLSPIENSIGGFLIRGYWIVLVMSLIFSLPTYIIYAIIFYYLTKVDKSFNIIKITLILIAIVGIYVTFTLIFPPQYLVVTFAYILTSLLSGIIFKLGNSQQLTTL